MQQQRGLLEHEAVLNMNLQNDQSGTAAALELRNLSVFLQGTGPDRNQGFFAVRDVDLKIARGEAFGIIGESGCGKSLTARAILGLIPKVARARMSGSVFLGSRPLHTYSEAELQKIRGRYAAIVFQDPLTALSPFYTIGFQLLETLHAHERLHHKEARLLACHLLSSVGISDPERRLSQYPHQFSGGMRQRVVIAMALAHHPELLIADEPTTGLDAATQVDILNLLSHLRNNPSDWQQKSRAGEKMAILFISHDFEAVSRLCSRVAVMYAGQIVEQGSTARVLHEARHPYARALLACLPQWRPASEYTLRPLAGAPPGLNSRPMHVYSEADHGSRCCFIDRCPRRQILCEKAPSMGEHGYRCHFPVTLDS